MERLWGVVIPPGRSVWTWKKEVWRKTIWGPSLPCEVLTASQTTLWAVLRVRIGSKRDNGSDSWEPNCCLVHSRQYQIMEDMNLDKLPQRDGLKQATLLFLCRTYRQLQEDCCPRYLCYPVYLGLYHLEKFIPLESGMVGSCMLGGNSTQENFACISGPVVSLQRKWYSRWHEFE